MQPSKAERLLVIACGALVKELRAVLQQQGLGHIDVHWLPAPYHQRPEKIVPAFREVMAEKADAYDRVVVGYADCGTGGLLDAALAEYGGIERIPGDHCYEFFAGSEEFKQLHAQDLGTFFLTDYLVKHFDTLIWGPLGMDKHPELRDMYFGNYNRCLYLTQTHGTELVSDAQAVAERLGLEFELIDTGLEPFAETVVTLLGAQ